MFDRCATTNNNTNTILTCVTRFYSVVFYTVSGREHISDLDRNRLTDTGLGVPTMPVLERFRS